MDDAEVSRYDEHAQGSGKDDSMSLPARCPKCCHEFSISEDELLADDPGVEARFICDRCGYTGRSKKFIAEAERKTPRRVADEERRRKQQADKTTSGAALRISEEERRY